LRNDKKAIEFLNKNGRFELKYLIDGDTCNLILERLSHFMKLDSNVNEKGYYINRSLYYDTPSFKEYHEYINGEKRRRKYRLRKYSIETNLVNFEVKQKVNKIIWKDKIKVAQDKAANFFINPWSYADDPEFGSLAHQLARKRYEPKCTVVYQRIALSDILNRGVRITFDYNLKTGKPEMFDREIQPNDLRVLPPGVFVMEVKFNRRIPNWCRNIISDFQLSYTTYSKYVQCVERLYNKATLINR
jgi:VTC domain-containing protein